MSQLPGERHPEDSTSSDPLATRGAHASQAGGSYGSSSGASSSYGSSSGASGTADVAKDQAAATAQQTGQEARHVAGVAKEQATGVASEAGRQAKDLLSQGRDQLQQQAGAQKQRAASGLDSLAGEFRSLANGEGGSGLAADLADQVATRASSAARWVGDREPGELLEEVQEFARRRPGAFLAIAAGVGLVAGRLTRGIAANAKEEKERAQAATSRTSTSGSYGAPAAGTTGAGWTVPEGQDDWASRSAGTQYGDDLGTTPLPAPDDRGVYGDPRGRVIP